LEEIPIVKIIIADRQVSRHHAKVVIWGGMACNLKDLGRKMAPFVMEKPVITPQIFTGWGFYFK
jgi:hypothetical protein